MLHSSASTRIALHIAPPHEDPGHRKHLASAMTEGYAGL